MEWTAIAFRIGLALTFSLLIGFNREKKDSPAGIRTHVIVGMSATLLAITQQLFMADYGMKETRLLAAVITGVGFLGAGAISSNKMYVKGLASAATVWTVACLGVVTGSGYYILAITGFIIIYLTLTGLKKYIYPYNEKRIELSFTNYIETKAAIDAIFACNEVTATSIGSAVEKHQEEQKFSEIFLIRCNKKVSLTEIYQALYQTKYIDRVEVHDI